MDTNVLNFGDFCYKFEENFTEIDKIGDISKFEILNPKIKNLVISRNLKSLTLKSKIFNFDKIWQKIKIPPRWFIITLRFHPECKNQNFPKVVPIWANRSLQRLFPKFWSPYQNLQNSTKLALITKILKKVCKDCSPIFWPILENFDFRIWVKSQSYDKPPWRNFDFGSNFVEIENFGF